MIMIMIMIILILAFFTMVHPSQTVTGIISVPRGIQAVKNGTFILMEWEWLRKRREISLSARYKEEDNFTLAS